MILLKRRQYRWWIIATSIIFGLIGPSLSFICHTPSQQRDVAQCHPISLQTRFLIMAICHSPMFLFKYVKPFRRWITVTIHSEIFKGEKYFSNLFYSSYRIFLCHLQIELKLLNNDFYELVPLVNWTKEIAQQWFLWS